MLITQSLTYQYPSGGELTFPDFSCNKGENMLILGKSGSGKTTLLHLLAGILSADGGRIVFDDNCLNEMGAAQTDSFRGKNIGMVFQKHFFMEGISVMENLKLACKLAETKVDTLYLENLLNKLEISHLAYNKPDQLSEGEQQRFSIARALVNKPSWILADEPTSSLDDDNCRNFVNLMQLSVLDKPVSWIIATHDTRLKEFFSNVYTL
jgi:ABC-type lipoprotein export system ATPase subunit